MKKIYKKDRKEYINNTHLLQQLTIGIAFCVTLHHLPLTGLIHNITSRIDCEGIFRKTM